MNLFNENKNPEKSFCSFIFIFVLIDNYCKRTFDVKWGLQSIHLFLDEKQEKSKKEKTTRRWKKVVFLS
jgi:hypothetical protein